MVIDLSDPSCSVSGLDGVVVLLIGRTGVGKSHFINVAAGQIVAPEYPGLFGSSSTVEAYRVRKPDPGDPGDPRASVILVDTPGLDSHYMDDLTILQKIQSWVNERCCGEAKFGGILYLEDITCNRTWPVERFTNSERSKRLMLVTSNWDQHTSVGAFERRERELMKGPWREMLGKGARYHRSRNTRQSAWEILDALLVADPVPLHVLAKDLKKADRSVSKKKQPCWRTAFKDLLPRGVPTLGAIVTQFVLSKDDRSGRVEFTAATPLHRHAWTESVLSDMVTGILHAPPTASLLSPTSTTCSAFDTESIVSSTETAFFSIEPSSDSEDYDRQWTASPDPMMYPVVEDVSLNISQERGASNVTVSSTSTPTLSSDFTQSIASDSESESDFSPSQVPLGTTTIPITGSSPGEQNITGDVGRVVANFFQSASRLNINTLNITVQLCNHSAPNG